MGQNKSKTLSLDFVKEHSTDPDTAWKLIEKNQTVTNMEVPLVETGSPKPAGHTRFVFISDTHNRTSEMNPLPEGDVLVHAGDFTMAGNPDEVVKFNEYLGSLPHKHKIVIAGNHEVTFDAENYSEIWSSYSSVKHDPAEVKRNLTNCVYLEDDEVTIEGFRIYGSPWAAKCGRWAFMRSRGDPLREKWNKIPEGIDILVTHGPPLGHGDLVNMFIKHRTGCLDLLYTVQHRVKPKYHVFGHIHEDGKTQVKVIAGESLGVRATIETRTPIMFLDICVQQGGTFTQEVPSDYNGFAYVWRGAGSLGKENVPSKMGQVAVLGNGSTFQMKAQTNQAIHVLLIAGAPINEPIARSGPFVMNTWEEIEQAVVDYQAGRLGNIDGAEERYAKTKAAVSTQKKHGTWNK